MVDQSVIKHMLENNGLRYNLRKAAEEFQELALVLIQKLNKKDRFVDDQEIIDEIGDCLIRLEILTKIFPEGRILERVDLKMDKFRKYISEDEYEKF